MYRISKIMHHVYFVSLYNITKSTSPTGRMLYFVMHFLAEYYVHWARPRPQRWLEARCKTANSLASPDATMMKLVEY